MDTDARLRNAVRTLERLQARDENALRLTFAEAMTPEELRQLASLVRKVIETRAKLERLRARAERLREALERFRDRQSSA